ncbi:MAG: superoxide dismutase family protein [Myxococcaceae bacterium]
MRHVLSALCIVATVSTAALAQDAGNPAAAPAEVTARAELKDAKGKKVGDAVLRQAAKGVVVELKLKGVALGEHAFHIHQVGKCEAPFESAGGHFNPGNKQHGIASAQGKHAGDLPNIVVPKSKELTVSTFTDAVTLTDGPNSVFDADGSALVVHSGPDDYASDPAGNAGDRIACGVIEKK